MYSRMDGSRSDLAESDSSDDVASEEDCSGAVVVKGKDLIIDTVLLSRSDWTQGAVPEEPGLRNLTSP